MRRDEIAERLLRIWRDVLQLAEVPPDANFFVLSGGSLEAVDLAYRVSSELGLDLTIMDVLNFPSFTEFASRVQEMASFSHVPDTDTGVITEMPLRRPSILQEESLRVDSIGPPSDHFLVRFGYLIRGPLDVPRLIRTIELVGQRHELLRAAVGWRDRDVFLEISDEPLQLRIIDAPSPPGTAPADHARAVALQRPDLTPTRAEPPLARFGLLRLGEDLHALVIALDHIISDGASVRLLVADISKTYGMLSVKPDFSPDDVPISFSRWAAEQRALLQGEQLAQLVAHWRGVLGDDPGILSPPLPWSGLRPGGPLTYTKDFGATTRQRISAAVQSHQMSPFSVGVAALGTSIAELVGPGRTCLTTTWVNRDTPAQLEVFGPVSHDMYLRLPVDPGRPVEQRLVLARAAVHDALEHAQVPGLVLYGLLWPASNSDPTLQPAVYVAGHERWASGFSLDGTEINGIPIEASESGRDLTCEFIVENGTISRIDFSSASSGITLGFMTDLASRVEVNMA
jgi:acyl carrier protein